MLFNSLTFALFLPLVVAGFWVLPRSWRTGLLLAASYIFYGWWDVRFLSLIVFSTLVDYVVARRIAASPSRPRRRRLLWVSIAVNLGLLAFFKYWGFFVDSGAALLTSIGIEANPSSLRVVLPVGISFYTFQTMSYTIDVYRGEMDPETNPLRFALFVAFFPQLVAGPIERASRLLPQLRAFPDRIRDIEWREAASLIGRGLFRKVVIADGVAPLVNEIFSRPQSYSGLTVALGIAGFSLQIYGDFAGYSDIARGVAKLFGVDLMVNFSAPYTARGFSEFWRRWHISLSTWLRDYLYIPLGGNRAPKPRVYFNLMVTMVLGGLWHGAGWGFVVWGALHGVFLVLERGALGARARGAAGALPAPLVFAVVSLTWIPFRSPNLAVAGEVLTSLFSISGPAIASAPWIVGTLGVLSMVLDQFDREGVADPTARLRPYRRGLVYGLGVVATMIFASQTAIPFIYFQF